MSLADLHFQHGRLYETQEVVIEKQQKMINLLQTNYNLLIKAIMKTKTLRELTSLKKLLNKKEQQ